VKIDGRRAMLEEKHKKDAEKQKGWEQDVLKQKKEQKKEQQKEQEKKKRLQEKEEKRKQKLEEMAKKRMSSLDKKVFGLPLEDVLDRAQSGIAPDFLLNAFEYIIAKAVDVEGIFRLSGSQSKIAELKKRIDLGEVIDFMNEPSLDVHSVSNLIKMYFRELPAPLFT
jgi:hypothetical protein